MSKTLVVKVQERSLGRGKHATAAVRKAVLMAMANRADGSGFGVWASHSTLARLADLKDDRAVRFCLEDFEQEGLIARTGKKGRQVIWRLDVAKIEQLPPALKAWIPESDSAEIPESDSGIDLELRNPIPPIPESDSGTFRNPIPPNQSNEPVHEPKNPPNPLRGNGRALSEEQGEFKLEGEPAVRDDGFQAAWLMWPQKGRSNKRAAQERWLELTGARAPKDAKTRRVKLPPRDAIAPVLLKQAVEAYLNSEEAQRKHGQYVPAFERWLVKRVDVWVDVARNVNKGEEHGTGTAKGNGRYSAHALRTGSKRNGVLRAALRSQLRRQQQGAGDSTAGKPGPEISAGPGLTHAEPGE